MGRQPRVISFLQILANRSRLPIARERRYRLRGHLPIFAQRRRKEWRTARAGCALVLPVPGTAFSVLQATFSDKRGRLQGQLIARRSRAGPVFTSPQTSRSIIERASVSEDARGCRMATL